MTSYPYGILANGAVLRLLDLCIDAQAEGSSVRAALTRFCRTVRGSSEAEWLIPIGSVAALLDLIVDAGGSAAAGEISATFKQKLSNAAAGANHEEFLRGLAKSLRQLDREASPVAGDLSLAPWEVRLRFQVIGECYWWVEGDEFESLEDAVNGQHPNGCITDLPELASKLQEAILMFPDDSSFVDTFAPAWPWLSRSESKAILVVINRHFDQFH